MTEHEKIKFRDDCAIAAMSLLNEDEAGVRARSDEDRIKLIVNNAFNLADAMLEEKLKRDNEKLS